MTDSKKEIKTIPNYVIHWCLAGFAAVIFLIAVIAINEAHQGTSPEQIESGIITDNGDLKINWERHNTYEVELSETYTITGSGIYHFTGELKDGAIIVNTNSEANVKLILDNVTIKHSSGPAIACYAADDLVIELIGENTIEDGKSYSKEYDEDVKGAIYSKSDLTFQGEGSLNLTASYQDGIVGKNDLKFNSGTYIISATDDAIRGKDSVYIVGGDFDLTAKGDGIKSTDTATAGKGFVLIENGNIKIAASDDGIHAEKSLIIENGNIDISKSYEGLEAQNILINGGDISIIASDDGINAGGGSDNTTNNPRDGGSFKSDVNCVIDIEDGNIYINASGDGVDSNGYIHFNGGTVIIDGPTNNGNGALDTGISINQAGGTVIAVGSSGMAETLGQTSSVNNISVYFTSSQKAGTKIEIKDADGNTIIEHTAAKAFNHLAVGAEEFGLSESYTIYLNDVKYQSFILTDITTTVGNSSNNQQNMTPGQGGRPNNPW